MGRHDHNKSRRLPGCAAALLVALSATGLPYVAGAHEGHLHSQERAGTAIPGPSVAARSDRTELVGFVRQRALDLYLDHRDSNAPIENAQLVLDTPNARVIAREIGPGHYEADLGALDRDVAQELVFEITGAGVADLLTAVLEPRPAVSRPAAPRIARWPLLPAGVLVLALTAFGLHWRRSHKANTRALNAWSVGILLTGSGLAVLTHPGITSLNPRATAMPGAAVDWNAHPRRLADGTVVIPKPAQRALSVRTQQAETTAVTPTHVLAGRVIADPSTGARIQTALAGTLEPPPGGFPAIGEAVVKGRLLARIFPAMSPGERARQESELATVEKDMYLIKKQIDRLNEQLRIPNRDNSVQLDIRRAEYRGLKQRRDAIRAAFQRRIEIRAPVDGVISEINMITGQTVSTDQTLASLVAPDHLRVEAVSYAPDLAGDIAQANATTADGRMAPLELIGAAYQLQGLARPIQFRVRPGAAKFFVGERVTVHCKAGTAISGFPLPHDSVSIDPTGATIVWVHEGPETFSPRRVTTMALSADRDLILDGLRPGDRVVKHAAALIAALP